MPNLILAYSPSTLGIKTSQKRIAEDCLLKELQKIEFGFHILVLVEQSKESQRKKCFLRIRLIRKITLGIFFPIPH
jgi:hypothetical protein